MISDTHSQKEKAIQFRSMHVGSLMDASLQVELLKAIREAGLAMDVPLVINARTDVFLLRIGDEASRVELAVERGNAYREAGADCVFPIGVSDAGTIAALARRIRGPINIVGGPPAPSLGELAQLGVARVSFASGLMRAALGHLRRVAKELLEDGTYTSMVGEMMPGSEFRGLFE